MHRKDKALTPQAVYTGTKAAIEALLDPQEGWLAQQTDSPYAQGRYANGAWIWGGAGDMEKSVYDPDSNLASPFVHVGSAEPADIYQGRLWWDTSAGTIALDFSQGQNSFYVPII